MNILSIATAGYRLRSCEECTDVQIDLCPPGMTSEEVKDSPQMQVPRILYERRALPYQRDCS